MILTLTDASKVVGKSVSTIYRAISQGMISASLTSNGKRGVEISELARVWELKHTPEEVGAKNDAVKPTTMTGHATDDDKFPQPLHSAQEVAFLREKVALLEKNLDDNRLSLEEARKERANLFDMVKNLQVRLLPAPSKESKHMKQKDVDEKKSKRKDKKKGKKKNK